jgi:hypothetical protein
MSIDIIITENPHYSASMAFVENITAKVDGVFSWTIEAFGGFATAHLEMVVNEADAYEMLNRLGKRVAFLSPDAPDKSLICWEGMIHSVIVDDGGATIARSMENCYNSVRVNYTGIDSSTTPPTTGAYEGTDTATDATSERLYGRRYLLYQAGQVSGATYALRRSEGGDIIRDLFLAQFANPRATTTTMRRGGGSSVSSLRVIVDCVGFVHELALGFHLEADTADATIDTILKAIVQNTQTGDAAEFAVFGTTSALAKVTWDLKFVNATDVTGISANSIETSRFNVSDKTTRTYIDELMRFGHDGGNPAATARRAFFGYYENRKFFYTREPTAYDYITRRNDPSEAIYDRITGALVPPWLVRPAKIIGVPDLLPEETVASEVLNTANAFCIGTVEFTAPATVVLTPVAPDPSGMWGTAQWYAATGLDITPLPPIPGMGGG